MGEEFCKERYYLEYDEIIKRLKRGEIISGAKFRAKDLIDAVLALRNEEGAHVKIKVFDSRIIGPLALGELGEVQPITQVQADKWNLPKEQNALFIPNYIMINSSFLDFVSVFNPRSPKEKKRVVLRNDVLFEESEFWQGADFSDSIFLQKSTFKASTFHDSAMFLSTVFVKSVNFNKADFNEWVHFSDSSFGVPQNEDSSWITAGFNSAIFHDFAFFERVNFYGGADFYGVTFNKGAHFRDSSFKHLADKSHVFSLVAEGWERVGDKSEENYYFYHQMVANRKLSPWFVQPFYWFAELTCGYGTKWINVLVTWIAIILISALLFSAGNGVTKSSGEYEEKAGFIKAFPRAFYFSVVTFTTLGYGDYEPKSGKYRVIASLESVLGAFMMALFVLVFAHAFMR